ncbi:hypothetical protein PILCRDRAFT_821150 [Piloderma croceum F 1598]|uniref:Uncharacterized protein n=1 Tax=Piloderma croceum (strain F 1598) TaxID=765440 RepID=A0A0C3FAW6_PILCF|nr:hypothetical protein PILCRDRAFT_821150 [Piloderma croceum F 1598]
MTYVVATISLSTLQKFIQLKSLEAILLFHCSLGSDFRYIQLLVATMDAEGEVHVPMTMHDIALRTRQTEVVNEISGITGYRLLGLLLAIAGLVKATLSAKGVSEPLKKMDLVVVGIFGIIYLCLGWAESSVLQFWCPFFRVDLSPMMFRCAVLFARCIAYLLYVCCCAALLSIIWFWPIGIGIYLYYYYSDSAHLIMVGSASACGLNAIFVDQWLLGPWTQNIDLKRFFGL